MFDLYRCIWNDLTWFGKITIFPILVVGTTLLLPVALLAILCTWAETFALIKWPKLGKTVHIFFKD